MARLARRHRLGLALALAAVAADTDLPGRITVVQPRNHGARVVASA